MVLKRKDPIEEMEQKQKTQQHTSNSVYDPQAVLAEGLNNLDIKDNNMQKIPVPPAQNGDAYNTGAVVNDNVQYVAGASPNVNPHFQQQKQTVFGGFTTSGTGTQAMRESEQQMSNIMELFRKPISTGSVSERTTQVYEIFVEYYNEARKTNAGNTVIDYILAPGNRISSIHGGFIVAIPTTDTGPTGKALVGVHLVIVETNLKLENAVENINGQPYTIYNTPGNTITDYTQASVHELVRKHYGSPIDIVDGGFSVIPVEADLTDVASVRRMADYATEGAQAAGIMFDVTNGMREAQALKAFVNNNSIVLHGHIEDNPQNVTDVFTIPIRSDFTIRTFATPPRTDNQQNQMALEIGAVNVFCTPVYVQPEQMVNTFNQPVQTRTQHYYNQIVVKNFRHSPELRPTVASYLLLLATSGVLLQDGYWKNAYKPNRHIPAGQLDIKDIGAFGYEVPAVVNPGGQPAMYNTKSDEFNNERFHYYMTALFDDRTLFQLDVPDGHYMLELFLAAAADGASDARGRDAARTMIYNIANELTGSILQTKFAPTEAMFHDSGIRVIDGYSISSSNNRKVALDEIDHLALLNLVSGDVTTMREYEKSITAVNQPASTRLALRTSIIDHITDNRAKVKGYSSRVTVDPKFMRALIDSLRQAGMFPQLNLNGFNRNHTYVRPTINQYASLLFDPSNLSSLANNYTPNNTGNGIILQRGYYSRPWG